MSDSDDDVPLGQRKGGNQPAAPAAAAPVAPAAAESSDDEPLAARAPAPAKRKQPASNGAASEKKEKKPRTTNKEPRQVKSFDLPGQTRETPDENDPARKFYTSLLEQRPDSAMARKWCVMNGLLSKEEAQAWVDENKGAKGGARTPQKPKAPPVKKETTSTAPKKEAKPAVKKPKPAIVDDSSDDDVPLVQRKAK